MDSCLCFSYLGSWITSFSPCSRLSVVTVNRSNTTPTPLLATLFALSDWSPAMGNISIGTAWQRPSKRPCEPPWVMKARTPGWANTERQRSKVTACNISKIHTVWSSRVKFQDLQTKQVILRHPGHHFHIFRDVIRNLPFIPPYNLTIHQQSVMHVHRT